MIHEPTLPRHVPLLRVIDPLMTQVCSTPLLVRWLPACLLPALPACLPACRPPGCPAACLPAVLLLYVLVCLRV